MTKRVLLLSALLPLSACGSSEVLMGPPGPQGEKGEKGDSGIIVESSSTAGMTIESGFTCGKLSNGFQFDFTGVKFSTGDVWTQCSIGGTLFNTSSSMIYKSTQNGASNYGCFLTWDLDASSGGYWYFRNISGTRTAFYDDAGSASDNTTVTFGSSDCSSY